MYIIWLKVEGIEEFRVWLCLCDEHRVGVLTAMFKSYAPLIQDILLCSTLLFFFSPSTATVPFYCFHFKSLNWPHILGQYLGTFMKHKISSWDNAILPRNLKTWVGMKPESAMLLSLHEILHQSWPCWNTPDSLLCSGWQEKMNPPEGSVFSLQPL